MPRYDNFTPEQLEAIRRLIEETNIGVIDDETRQLVEKRWPELAAKLAPQTKQ